MAKLIDLQIREQEAFVVAGKALRQQMGEENRIPALWDRCFADGAFASLEALSDWVLCPDYVGFMSDWQSGDSMFTYTVGMMMKPGCPVPEGFTLSPVPAGLVAVGLIQGGSTQEVCASAHQMTEEALREKGYTDKDITWCMELYNCPRFTTPDDKGQIILDYCIPCRKA